VCGGGRLIDHWPAARERAQQPQASPFLNHQPFTNPTHRTPQADLIRQLASISMTWYQHASQHLAMAGLGAMLRLATTLAALHQRQGSNVGGDAHWALLIDMVAQAAREDVGTVVTLARQQQAATTRAAEAAAAAGGPASAVPSRLMDGAGALSSGSPGGSPRSPSAYAARALAAQQQLTGSPLASRGLPGLGSGSGSSNAAAAANGDRSRRTSAAASSPMLRLGEAQMRTLRVRARQLVLLQRALGEMHARCLGEISWGVQMRLLDVLGETVAAAMAFNTEAATGQLQPQQGGVAASSSEQAASKVAFPGASGVSTSSSVGPSGKSVSDAAGLGSAFSATSSISALGLVERPGSLSFTSRAATLSDSGASSSGPSLTLGVALGAAAGAAAPPARASGSLSGSVGPSTQPSVEIEAAEPLEAPPGIEDAAAVAAAGSAAAISSQAQAATGVPASSSSPFEPLARAAAEPAAATSNGSGAAAQKPPGAGLTIATRPAAAAAAAAAGSGSPRKSRLPELLVTSVESSEVVGLALMRLEVEGGTQLIQVRCFCVVVLARFIGGALSALLLPTASVIFARATVAGSTDRTRPT